MSEDDLNHKKGLKSVSGTPSSLQRPVKRISAQEFEEKASDTNARLNGYIKTVSEQSSKFMKLLADKTLPANKSPIAIDIERDLRAQMLMTAQNVNNDEDEKAGMGTLSLTSLLLNIALMYRDRFNRLEKAYEDMAGRFSTMQVDMKDLKERIKAPEQK